MSGAATTVEVRMPKLGDTVVEGTLVEWLVEPGAQITEGDLLVEITTDKVSTEYPSEITGTLVEILVAQGETVPVGTPIARVATESAKSTTESVTAEAAAPGAPAQPSTAVVQPPDVVVSSPSEIVSPPSVATGAAADADVQGVDATTERDTAGAATARAAPAGAPAAPPQPPDRPRATGAARAAAAAAGLDVAALPGSGRHGRVREADVARTQRPAAQPAAPVAAAPAAASAAGRPAGGLSPMRRAIAEHMTRAWSGAPHAAVFGQADLTAVVDLRQRERARFRRRHGADLTALPFFVGALARAVGGGDIGIAVALDEGLIVPVVRDAHGPWGEVAVRVADLVDRARRGALQPDETSGGVSTITNLGVFGAVWAQPILNQGQTTILGLGTSAVRPVAQPDGFRLATTAPLSLVYDRHRLDEVEASALLGRITAELSEPR